MDYEEALLQVTDVLKANNRYRLGDFEQAVTLIREIVTPKGKWLSSTDHWYHTCSECKREILKNGAYDSFCPNCGADMRGDV